MEQQPCRQYLYGHHGRKQPSSPPLLTAYAELAEAASELIEHYGEQKKEVEEHKTRIIHLDQEKLMNIYDALAKLQALVGTEEPDEAEEFDTTPCCENESRDGNGGCTNCGDPSV